MIPGLIVLPFIGGLADDIGARNAIVVAIVPVFLIGAAIIASAGRFVDADIHKVRRRRWRRPRCSPRAAAAR